ncbi:DUF1763-domain-containing protein [Cryphonectria parasitica EP155]|uniref:DUF1763-domain-containing protein n=1 Tax=Cryphonectria parasitica (strain ATCC 38755 / EP155) TaxID=660469 RepID=A0A9P4Y462_CRYP1|nr:DUF1763-domain-containing protein [Cryphonectria parasitica EP155]KAF3766211.1 DUF1763-domain-containing protein [Cryphonectria parasitica EP155]
MANRDVVRAYRHLYRSALKAVCYSQPASTVVRGQLRQAFRAPDAKFDERAIQRTVWFLKNAARNNGIEHRIVRNMLFVKWAAQAFFTKKVDWIADFMCRTLISETAYVHYNKTIGMLNKTMGICLPLP